VADTWGGSAFAVVAVAIVSWFVAFNLVNGPFPGVASEIRESAVVRGLDTVLPQPPAILAEARGLLDRFGFPQVFSGLPPAPSGPVDAPTRAEAERAFKQASASTVRVVGQACDRIQEGSGFVVAPNEILTNAHVVAGVRSPHIQSDSGLDETATTVLFDPRLDVAILRVAEDPGPVLALAGQQEPRGTGGAVVGYPGGGQLTGVPAAVRATIHAVGRDIYGQGTVERDVYQLQAVVRPGNSGGPFILPSGPVAGLVFAASTTDEGIGYAIASGELSADAANAASLTSPVSTGDCLA
jgi:S1-C subfamily serine protease